MLWCVFAKAPHLPYARVCACVHVPTPQVALQMQEQRPALSPASDPRAYAMLRTMRSVMQVGAGWGGRGGGAEEAP